MGMMRTIPRTWIDSQGHRAVIMLFSEMSDGWVKGFSEADAFWHKEEAGKGRKWLSREKREALMALLNLGLKKLTEKQKECIYLYYYQNKTIIDISVILGTSGPNVYVHIRRGIEKLREFLGLGDNWFFHIEPSKRWYVSQEASHKGKKIK